MIHTIVFSRTIIDKNRNEGCALPPITILLGKSVHGLIIKKRSLLIYDPRCQHRAYLTVDCDDYDIEEQGIVTRPQKNSRTCYVYVQRDAVKKQKEAPCLTLKRNNDKSKYAYQIQFPGTIKVVYTTGKPFLGGGGGKTGARLWIESEDQPSPVPQWFDSAYFKQCCGYKKAPPPLRSELRATYHKAA